jgi:regulator of cell morphogenesis and NO signaling
MRRIEERHHVLLREEVPRLQALVGEALEGRRSPYAGVFRSLAEELARLWFDLDRHLRKEEAETFPLIRRLEDLRREGGAPPEGDASQIEALVHEHENAYDRLERIRRLTGNYALPQDAGEVLRDLYGGLQALEDDLRLHIELEDGVLIPRALALMQELLPGMTQRPAG